MSDSALNYYVASGADADRLAFTPSPPTVASGPDPLYIWVATDTGLAWYWDLSAGPPDWAPWPGGGIGGSTGATDEAILVADGVGGATLQATPVLINPSTGLITFPDDIRQTFNPGANAAGLNVGSIAGDPATPTNGDLWYDSTANELTARINGTSVALGAGSGITALTGDIGASGSGSVAATLQVPLPPGGRLTLTSDTPVMTADATAQGTVYYAPYVHARVPIYTGSLWQMRAFTQLSLVLNASDNLSGSVYDIWLFDASGTLTLGTGPAWTSTTARGAGAGTTELELKGGIWTNKVSITLKAGGSTVGTPAANTATYLGTIYCTANGQTGMSFRPAAANGGTNNFLGLYNAYNRVRIEAMCRDAGTGTDYTYNSATWRSANNNAANRISWVDGLQQSRVQVMNMQVVYSNGVAGVGYIGTNLDSTSAAPEVTGGGGSTSTTAIILGGAIASQSFAPQLGFHFAQRMEAAVAGTATFSVGVLTPTRQNNALTLSLDM